MSYLQEAEKRLKTLLAGIAPEKQKESGGRKSPAFFLLKGSRGIKSSEASPTHLRYDVQSNHKNDREKINLVKRRIFVLF